MQHLVAWVLTASRVEFQETNSDFHCIVIISCPYIIGIKHSYMQWLQSSAKMLALQKMVCGFLKSERCSFHWNFGFFQFHYTVAYPTVCVCAWDSYFCISSVWKKRDTTQEINTHTKIVRYGFMCLWYHTNTLFIPKDFFWCSFPETSFDYQSQSHVL